MNNKTFFVNKIFSLICLMILVMILSNVGVLSFLFLSFKNKAKDGPKVSRVIEVWNVDSFDAGNYSKTTFLEKAASKLFVANTGLCIVVKNITKEACVYNFSTGLYPDMISYSHDLKDDIKSLLQPMSLSADIVSIDKSVYMQGNDILAASWCAGAYFIFGNKTYLEKVSMTGDLLSNISNCSIDKKTKNKSIKIYSAVYGINGIEDYAKLTTQVSESSNVVKKQSGYDAYTYFTSGASTLLFGTQRDLVRIIARQDYASNYMIEFESSYNNLYQYISILTEDLDRQLDCNDYIKYLLSDGMQSMMDKFGMFSPTGCMSYENLQWINYQKLFNKISNVEAF